MINTYSFTTIWKIKAPLQQVWDAIFYSKEWHAWWKDFKAVEDIVKGDEREIGTIRSFKLKTPFFYTLSFSLQLTERIDFQQLKANASGELEGSGEWYFSETNGITTALCVWKVATNIPWMNKLAFFLKPVFVYNHHLVMQHGARYLAEKLNGELISAS